MTETPTEVVTEKLSEKQPAQVFISYRRSNITEANLVREQLTQNGIQVFHDIIAIEPGNEWMAKLEQGLVECSAFIALIGKEGVTKWMEAEVDIALDLNVSEKKLNIFPVLLPDGNFDILPRFLKRYNMHKWNPETPLPKVLIDAIDSSVTKVQTIHGCPYLGLNTFQMEHANRFFGRQREMMAALRLLGKPGHDSFYNQSTNQRYNRWLQIEGNSGSGKSSFMNAALIPQIENNFLSRQTGYESWSRIGILKPGINPLTELAGVLDKKFFTNQPDIEKWIKKLQEEPNTLKYALRDHKINDQAFYLAIDQLEELLTLADTKERLLFDQQISNALSDSGCQFFLITTIRSDFLGEFDKLPGLSKLYNQICGKYLLGTMTLEGLKEIIVNRSLRAGIDASDVTSAILNDARDEPGVLPLVENALLFLWEHMKVSAGNKQLDGDVYHQQGGIAGLLEKQANALLDSLGDDKQKKNALELLLRLTHIGPEGRNTRQRIPYEEAVAIAGNGNNETGRNLINKLAGLGGKEIEKDQTGLRLIIVAEEGFKYVDLIHETLIRPRGKNPEGRVIGYWDRLYTYIDENRDREILRQQLKHHAKRWQDSQGLGRWWNLAGLRDAYRYKTARPLKGTLENQFILWSQRKNLFNLGIILTLTAYFSESYAWTVKHELPVSSIYLLQKFRLGYAPLPEMVNIKAYHEFMMGEEDATFIKPIPQNRYLNFNYPPQLRPAPSPFSIGKYEVTFEEFDYFVWHQHRNGNNDLKYPATSKGGRDRQPAASMTWDEANDYAQWLGKMKNLTCYLPSEEQWEYAAKAGSHTGYPWGNDVGKNNANCDGCGSEWDGDSAAPVGQFLANAFGLHDMNGNVWEMTRDMWATNNNESTEIQRVVRGGSHFERPAIARSTARFNKVQSQRHYHMGFRVACDLPTE